MSPWTASPPKAEKNDKLQPGRAFDHLEQGLKNGAVLPVTAAPWDF
jgi:hypothetical protein